MKKTAMVVKRMEPRIVTDAFLSGASPKFRSTLLGGRSTGYMASSCGVNVAISRDILE